MKPCADSDDEGGRALSRRLGTTTSSATSWTLSSGRRRSSSLLCGGARMVRRSPSSRRSPAPSFFLGIALLFGIGLLSGDPPRFLRASAHKNTAAAAAGASAPAGSASMASSRGLPSLPTSGPAPVRGREDDSRARHPSPGPSSRGPFFIGATQEAVHRIPRGGGHGADATPVDTEDDPGAEAGDADDGPDEDEPPGGERPSTAEKGEEEGEASVGSDEGKDGASRGGDEAGTEPEDVDEDEGSVTASTSSSAATEEEEKDGDGVGMGSEDAASSSSSIPNPVNHDNDASHDADNENDGSSSSSSSAYVDRMELADDEGGETTPGGGYEEREAQMPPPTPSQGMTPSSAASDSADPQENGEASLPETSTGTDQADVIGSESVATTEGENAAASDEAAAATVETAASLEVTDEMKHVLTRELRYTKEEANSIKPDHAIIAIKNRLSRPWEGMPPNWFRRDASHQVDPPSSRSSPAAPAAKRKRWVAQVTLSVLVGAAVVQSQVASGKIDPTEIVAVFVAFKDRITPGSAGAGPSSRKPRLTPRPTAASAADKKEEEEVDSTAFQADTGSESSASSTSTSATTAPTATDPLPVNEHVNALGEPHEHSVRPGVPSRPADESELDVTWLDKAITAVERSVQNLFRPKRKPHK